MCGVHSLLNICQQHLSLAHFDHTAVIKRVQTACACAAACYQSCADSLCLCSRLLSSFCRQPVPVQALVIKLVQTACACATACYQASADSLYLFSRLL